MTLDLSVTYHAQPAAILNHLIDRKRHLFGTATDHHNIMAVMTDRRSQRTFIQAKAAEQTTGRSQTLHVIQLPVHHWLAKWVLDAENRTKNVHITVDKDGARWGGRMRRMKLRKEDNGQRFVELQFLHDYEELKRIQIWSNPFLPAAVQFPRASVMAGPSAWTLKTMLIMNLVRLNASLWHLPNDPLDIRSWGGSRFDMHRWGIVVKPGSIAQDSSPWTIVSSRFKFWHDMAESTLGDAQLMVECRRYLDGDPEPWPGANLRNGALVIDIVDKSGHWSNDGHGSRGNIFTGILRSITRLGDNLVDESQVFIDEPTEVEEYQQPGFLGTNQKQPYVTYRDGAITGVEAAEFTWERSEERRVGKECRSRWSPYH